MIIVEPSFNQLETNNLSVSTIESSFDNFSQSIEQGVYTTFRTYKNNFVIDYESQINRLIESASLENKKIKLDPFQIRTIIRTNLPSGKGEYRIRIHVPLNGNKKNYYIMIESLKTPSRIAYLRGVAARIINLSRKNPESKSTQFITDTSKIRENWDPKYNEVLLSNDAGEIHEGMSSNFFGVIDGSVITADEGVLKGLTRKLVLEVCARRNITVTFRKLNISELVDLDESFITSASRGVLPVTEIDGFSIGSGKPGETTRKIMRGFDLAIESKLEAL